MAARKSQQKQEKPTAIDHVGRFQAGPKNRVYTDVTELAASGSVAPARTTPLRSLRKDTLMASTDTDLRTGKRSSATQDTQELADQIDAIRNEIQNLTGTVTRIANKQIGRAQDKAVEAATQAEDAIKQNPLSAVAIAVGLGFLFGVLTRR
jgi:ElaB/YqjD/DUF883 family membrane-anchored ribosome-binding protein